MPRHYFGLDGVRFCSALIVCVFHLCFYAWASHGNVLANAFAHRASFETLVPVAWFGWIGVQIFFVISGFVIAASANGATPMAFLRSRALRLLPAAWVCATITLAMRLSIGEPWTGLLDINYLHSMVLWPHGAWIDGVYWSLAVEIAFYALVFMLLLAKSFARLPMLAWALAVLSSVFIVFDSTHMLGDDPLFLAIAREAEFLPLRHGVYFSIGIWLWMLANRVLPRSGWVGLALAGGFALVQIWGRAAELRYLEAPAALTQSVIVPALVWVAAVGVILVFTRWAGRFDPRSGAARTFLKQAGKVTYPLYLVHSVAGVIFMGWLIDMGLPAWIALPCAIGVAIGVATVIALYAEPAIRRVMAKGFDWIEPRLRQVRALGGLFQRADGIPLPKAA